jgi:hypothetical protein
MLKYNSHMMMVNVGGGKGARGGIGSYGGGGMPGMFYSIRNNRAALTYPGTGTYLPKGTTFQLVSELASMRDEPVDIYVTVDYEWLPGKPPGYMNILAIPQDASGGNPRPPAGKSTFVFTSRPTKLTVEGKVLSQYGFAALYKFTLAVILTRSSHLHDGGIHTEIFINGKMVCDSKTEYGTDPTYIQTGKNAGLDNSALGTPKQIAAKGTLRAITHISNFGECPGTTAIHKGDQIVTKAYYNYTERPTLLNLRGMPSKFLLAYEFLKIVANALNSGVDGDFDDVPSCANAKATSLLYLY